MFRRHLMILMAFILPIGVNAQLPLDSVLAAIERNNPGLKQFDTRINALNAYAKGARSWEPPRLGAGPFMTPYRSSENMNSQMGSVMFSVEQMIPNPRKQQYRADYMQSMALTEKENLNYGRNQLFAQAKQVYYEAAVLQRKQDVLKSSEDLLKFMLEVAEMRYSYQKEELSNIYKVKSSLAKLENEQLVIENALKQKKVVLNTLMNRDKQIEFVIDTLIALEEFPTEIPDTANLLEIRSDLKALDRTVETAKLNLRLEQSTRLPDFGIRYDHMTMLGNEPNQFSVMAMITIPIAPWSARGYKANIEGLNYELQGYQLQKQSILNEVSGRLLEIRINSETKRKQLKLYEERIIPALESSYKAELTSYEQNTGDLFKVLDAWETLLMTKMEYLTQLQEYINMQVEYERELEQR